MDTIEIKRRLGERAAEFVQSDMIVGLGTGSTAECFIRSLVHRVKEEKLKIRAVASSKGSGELAASGGICVLDLNEVTHVDLTVDGADEIDPERRMIKGAGGALLREKILAAASRDVLIIADESKLVDRLGKTKLPLEILCYGAAATARHIESLGYKGAWRKAASGRPSFHLPGESQELFLTDNGHLIFDLFFSKPPERPEELQEKLMQIPGVLGTGFFFHLAKKILVGYLNTRIELI